MGLGLAKGLVIGFLAFVLVMSTLVGGLTIASGPARAATTPRTFNIGIVNLNVVTYNPMAITLVDEYVVVYNVYSTLITWDANYNPKPDLAYNWTLSSDQLTWTFHLVHNAYFTDPTNPSDRSHPVTSADVYFTYSMQQNQTASIFHSYVSHIVSMSAPDPYTFTFSTAEPFAAMYSIASTVVILPKYVWQGINNPVHYSNLNPIGSGAMYYDSLNASFGNNFIFRRNPNYFGDQMYCQFSRPDIVYYKDYTSATTMVQDFMAGTSGLDAIMNLDPQPYLHTLPANAPSNPLQKFAVNNGFIGEFALNVMTPQIRAAYNQFKSGSNNQLLLNDTVREAIAMSVNRTALVKYALLGLGEIADTLIPTSNPWHYSIPASDQYHFDPVAARALLNAAGWKYDSAGNLNPGATPLYQAGGTNPLKFRLYTLNTANEWQLAVANISAWLAQTGVQSTDSHGNPGYSLLSESQLGGDWFTGDYDMWLWDWVMSPYYDPSLDIMEVETTMAIGPTSDNFYSNSTYDSLYNTSLVTVDPVARRNLTNTLQKIIYDYHSYILPYYRLDLYAVANGRPPSYTSGWTNYGNWTQSPGLTPDSAYPVSWFQFAPLDNKPPTITSFPTASGVNTLPTTISVSASDPENDIQNYFWNFGDGSFTNTSGPTVQHTYASVGTYAVSVRVSDAEFPACGSTTVTISQYVPGVNYGPQAGAIVATLSNGTFGLANLTQKFSLPVSDPENSDTLFITWNFGDGKTATSTVTGALSAGVTANTTHVYTTAGSYAVAATVTDNQTGGALPHTVDATPTTVRIQYPSSTGGGGGGGGGGGNAAESNPWINYGVPLIIVAAVVLAVAIVLLRRRKVQKEDQQQEGPPQGPQNPPPP